MGKFEKKDSILSYSPKLVCVCCDKPCRFSPAGPTTPNLPCEGGPASRGSPLLANSRRRLPFKRISECMSLVRSSAAHAVPSISSAGQSQPSITPLPPGPPLLIPPHCREHQSIRRQFSYNSLRIPVQPSPPSPIFPCVVATSRQELWRQPQQWWQDRPSPAAWPRRTASRGAMRLTSAPLWNLP